MSPYLDLVLTIRAALSSDVPSRRTRIEVIDMPLIPDAATFQKSLAMLPVTTYEPGEMVISAGASTGKLLLLRQGAVEVVRNGTQIARISEPGSVFGELAVLLDKPHTADVRALERSEFNVADAATLLTSDPAGTLYIAAILAARLDAANVALIDVKRQLELGEPRVGIVRRINQIADLLSSGGGNLGYVGSPYGPLAASMR
jgi:CRP/FNR family transcriptional regulator, cyclic AMP receptor protein